ncbi:FIG022160: hypothetical toxin [uncultured Candidatus Thioglobus sp.]|nr:FIG022160: hypothetical toxin [uncultured Candidatus Thioglobus sp.]SMN00147.1 FIG022160: hypothetical toxin [uncultured Candidatus Thioglobus sp.]
MYEIREAPEFIKWFTKVKDPVFRAQFVNRKQRIAQGNFGFNKRLSEDIFELKFKVSKGYRVYYILDNGVLLLFGGVKDTQSKDIKFVKKLLQKYKE